MLGYGLVDTVVAGQMLSAVNGKGMSIAVGIVISAVITWVVTLFGMQWFHAFERWAFIPQVMGLLLLIGCAGPHFDTTTPSAGSSTVITANRLSYVFLCASGPIGWAPAAADFYVYFSPTVSRWTTFSLTAVGLCSAKLFVTLLGIGLGSGLTKNPAWAAAFDISTGALYVESLAPLTTFGKIFATIFSLGMVANNIPGTYSAALSFQTLSPWAEKIPRVIWCTIAVVIYTVCAVVGQSHFLTIFLNFLALIGYWVIIWVVMTAVEQVIFRRKRGYDWTAWDTPQELPVGVAALISFLIGWAGAILCMDQVYYVGPIASRIGEGSDIGFPIAAVWTAVVFPPLRYLEIRYFGR
ncbi:Vitamin B6 transporter [Paecilomyces lecythidis]